MTKDFYQLEFKNEVIYMDPLISKLWTVLNFKVLTSTVLRSASRVQRPGFRVQRPGSNVQSPTSRVQRPESSVQLLRPESRNSGMPNVRQRRNSVVIFKVEFHIFDQRRNKDQLQKVEKNKKISLNIKKKKQNLKT